MDNKLQKIFIISGKARQGKDTIGEFIKEYYKDLKILHLPNNYYMRDYAKRITDWDGSDETKPRDLLISLADYGRKNIDEHFYIKRTIEDIKMLSNYFDIVLITDARFPYEIELPKKEFDNVISIHVERPEFVSELSSDNKKHATETSLDNFDNYDYKITNDGTLDDLKNKVINLLDNLN